MSRSDLRAPSWLDPEARKEFRRLVDTLGDGLHVADRDVLASYCSTLIRWRRAMKIIEAQGETTTRTSKAGETIVVLRPEARLSMDLGARLLQLQRALRMTPKSRGVRGNLPEPAAPLSDVERQISTLIRFAPGD